MSAKTINIIDHRKRASALASVASRNAAANRTADYAAGLLRIDGQVVIAADKAREFKVAPKDLRAIVGLGFNTSDAISRWAKSKQRPDVWAQANRA